jgi:hypothetical protein
LVKQIVSWVKIFLAEDKYIPFNLSVMAAQALVLGGDLGMEIEE